MRLLIFSALIQAAFGQQPTIQSIENAASSVATAVVPQMLVAIHGANLSAQTVTANQSPLPVTLGGATVSVNGVDAPLLYVSPGQINAQIPSAVETSGTVSIVVTTEAGASDPFSIAAAIGQPGIFTQDASGCGQAVVFNVHADGSLTMNTPETSLDPVHDTGLTVLLTGLGPFPDRTDGVPWQFNPADNRAAQYSPLLGIPVFTARRQN